MDGFLQKCREPRQKNDSPSSGEDDKSRCVLFTTGDRPLTTTTLLPQANLNDAAEIQRLICVRHPYYALEGLRVISRGSVECFVQAEQDLGSEVPPMRAAEAGRHMAILGSFALASLGERQGQHFYLAKAARLEGLSALPAMLPFQLLEPIPLRGHAYASFTGKREGQAVVTLTTEAGLETHKLIVEYNVLSRATFYRLFAAHRVDLRRWERGSITAPVSRITPDDRWECVDAVGSLTVPHPLRNNPYKDSIPLAAFTIEDRAARAEIPCITPDMCNGHFAEVPLLPIAIVMGSLSQVAGALFLALNGNPTRYRVLSADIAAHRFAEAGKALFLTASLTEIRCEQVFTFRCEATTTDGLVGEMSISLASD